MRAAARCSLVGRFFLAVVRILGRVFADSVTFGTRHAGSRRLGRSGHPVSVLAISRPYLWLRAALGGGAPGRMLEAAEVGAAHSRFGGGIWSTVAGGGIFALGCGRLALLLARGSTTFGETGSALNASRVAAGGSRDRHRRGRPGVCDRPAIGPGLSDELVRSGIGSTESARWVPERTLAPRRAERTLAAARPGRCPGAAWSVRRALEWSWPWPPGWRPA